jgi:serine/threonine protein phosphatase PrpC
MRSLVTSSLSASQVSVLNIDPKWNEEAQEQPAIRKLLAGDILLFCTDGLTSEVDPAVYLNLFGGTGEAPDSIAWACLGAALGAGGRDNVTVAAITVK